MNGFLNVNCSTHGSAFTKIGQCAAFEGTPKALIFTSQDASYDATSASAFTAELDVDLSVGKAFAITDGIVNLESSGGESRVAQEGFGASKANGWEAYSEVYTINKGGLCLLRQLLKVDGRDMRMMVVDDKDVIYGESVDNGAGIRGYKVSLGISRRVNNGTDTGAIRLSAYYSLDYLKEMTRVSAVQYSGDDILTILPVRLAHGSSVTKFAVVDSCSGEALDATTLTMLDASTKLELFKVGAGGAVTAIAITSDTAGELTVAGVVAGDEVGLRVKVPGTAIGTNPLFFGVEEITITA